MAGLYGRSNPIHAVIVIRQDKLEIIIQDLENSVMRRVVCTSGGAILHSLPNGICS